MGQAAAGSPADLLGTELPDIFYGDAISTRSCLQSAVALAESTPGHAGRAGLVECAASKNDLDPLQSAVRGAAGFHRVCGRKWGRLGGCLVPEAPDHG